MRGQCLGVAAVSYGQVRVGVTAFLSRLLNCLEGS